MHFSIQSYNIWPMAKRIESLGHNKQSDYLKGYFHRFHRSRGGQRMRSTSERSRKIMHAAARYRLSTFLDESAEDGHLQYPFVHRNRMEANLGVPRRLRDYFI